MVFIVYLIYYRKVKRTKKKKKNKGKKKTTTLLFLNLSLANTWHYVVIIMLLQGASKLLLSLIFSLDVKPNKVVNKVIDKSNKVMDMSKVIGTDHLEQKTQNFYYAFLLCFFKNDPSSAISLSTVKRH